MYGKRIEPRDPDREGCKETKQMKILACVTVGCEQIIRNWDSDGRNLIIAAFEERSIALPLDKSKIHPTMTREEFEKQLLQCFSGPGRSAPLEHIEAFADSFNNIYLGALNIADATVLRLENLN